MKPEFTAVKNTIKPNKVNPRPINMFLISSLSSLNFIALKTKNNTVIGISAVIDSKITGGKAVRMGLKIPSEKTYSSATP